LLRVIVSASYRTDIPAFYAEWLMRRLRAGYCRVANPYGGGAYEVALTPEAVDGFVFWTRNMRPLMADLDAVRRIAPFVVQFTLTGYPRALESSVIAVAEAVAQLRELRHRFGPRAAVWRYDPIVFAAGMDAAAHEAEFTALAEALAGTVDEVVLSVMTPYKKTRRNLDRAGRRHGFAWEDPPLDEKQALLAQLAGIAVGCGLAPTLCSQPDCWFPGWAKRVASMPSGSPTWRIGRSQRARTATGRAAVAPSRAISAPTIPARMAASIATRCRIATAPSLISAPTIPMRIA
jgi:uncharacterized protein DUF1848